MKFETFTQGARTVYPVFLAGFHDNFRCLEGETFLNPKRAHQYCENKVIHVKEVPFYSQESAEKFVNQMAHRHVNHAHALGIVVNLDQIECDEFRKVVKKVINE